MYTFLNNKKECFERKGFDHQHKELPENIYKKNIYGILSLLERS